MPRPRSFDDDAVIDAAMLAFWRGGYDGTPIGALEEATGVKRISLYNAWGDKEGLFVAALDRYHEGAKEVYEGTVAGGGLDGIQRLFRAMSAPAEEDAPVHSGCLMVNTVLDVRRMSDPVRRKVEGYRSMIQDAFLTALRNARDAGEMEGDDETLAARADFLLATLWGLLALIRQEGRTTAAGAAAGIAAETVESWRAAASGP
ncbi:TetR/AcrR family transcriptional regulator [Aestuariibius insulae]|uniref:TetR/AcrR family transcriptional regulator n=1 Tax=Aestuariibius insulae TaxID=2058287 RepID=UPI00345EA825